MDGPQVPNLQQLSVILFQSCVVIAVSGIVVPMWQKYYRKWFVLLHSIAYSSTYYHWTADLTGSIWLSIGLATCILGVYHTASHIAAILGMAVFGAAFRASQDFLFMFLLRGLFDICVDNLEEVAIREHSEKAILTNAKHLVVYTISTVYAMKTRSEHNGREDLLLFAIIGGQIYAMFYGLIVEDTVIAIALFSFAWAKVKSWHVPDTRSSRMRPIFVNEWRALAGNPRVIRALNVFRNIIGI